MTDSRNYVVLRDHIVRRLPMEKDLLGRGPLTLTARDRDILSAIDRHGFLTVDLIGLAYFPARHPSGRAATAAYDRLRQLWLWGFVERIELPVARVRGGSRPYLYALGQRGVRFLDAQDAGPSCRRRLARSSDLYVDHTLAVAAFWANVVAMIRTRPIRLGAWVPERELRARQLRVTDPRTRRSLPFLPDAYLELHYASGRVQCCLLEVDLGTHSLARMRRKLRAFELALSEGLVDRLWQRADLEVLLVASSERRLERVRTLARQVVPAVRHDAYFFAPRDILDASRFADAAWRCLDGTSFGLLYRDGCDGVGRRRPRGGVVTLVERKPDAIFAQLARVDNPGNLFLLLMDRRTMSPYAYRAKLDAHVDYDASGRFERDHKGFPTILVVITQDAIEERLVRAVQIANAGRVIALSRRLTPDRRITDVRNIDGLLGPIWRTTTSDVRQPWLARPGRTFASQGPW